jgi:hypothetical protein
MKEEHDMQMENGEVAPRHVDNKPFIMTDVKGEADIGI